MPDPRPRRWPAVLLVLALALGGAYWWLFVEVPAPAGSWAIDLEALRRLGRAVPGEKATQVRVERVQDFSFPGAVMRAGDGWGLHPMQVFAYQLVFPDRTVVVDTALHEPLPLGQLHPEAWQRLQGALAKADLILITHEHGDHIGGLLAHPQLARLLKGPARLTREQVSHPELADPVKVPPGAFDGYQPLEYQGALALAPGVVVVRAPGHTPGSQLVYVELADGEELLFLGDVAWSTLNLEAARERPRAVGLLLGEDRPAVVRQLEQLQALKRAAPRLHVLPGHDPSVVDALVARHLLQERFTE